MLSLIKYVCTDYLKRYPSGKYYVPIPHDEVSSDVPHAVVTASDVAFSTATEGNGTQRISHAG